MRQYLPRSRNGALATLLFLAFLNRAAAAPGHPLRHAGSDSGALQFLRLVLSGPLILLLVIACLAVVALLAAAFGRSVSLGDVGLRSSQRLERGRAVPTLWGLAAGVFLFLLAAVLFGTKVPILGLLGLIVLLLGLALVGCGLGVAALSLGRGLAQGLDPMAADDLVALRLGLAACFLAVFLPIIGWGIVLLIAASGLGAVLETLFAQARRG